MYIPPKFQIDDAEVIAQFIKDNSFGLLLTTSEGEIHDTHTPFIINEHGLLIGHIALANTQWKSWNSETQAKVIFSGAHAYISPSYYESDFNVPTWNYTAVSVSGALSIMKDKEQIFEFLDSLVAHNESSDCPWKLDREDARYMKLLSGIVVFSVSMDKVEASFKLNQNKTTEDKTGVIRSLAGSGCPFDHKVASLMQAHNEE